MYIVNFYIGREYTPGEVLPKTVPQEVVDRLLKAGAIRKVAPAPDFAVKETEDEGTEQEAEPKPKTAAAGKDEDRGTENEPAEDEIDEDAEPEEIDVMAGIVTDTKAPSRSKNRTGGRKAK